MWAMLATSCTAGREHRVLGREDAVDPELGHEPAVPWPERSSLPPAIAPAWPTARVSFDLPAADHAGDHRFGEVGIELVVAAGFGVEDGRLGARHRWQARTRTRGRRSGCRRPCPLEISGRGAPAGHAQVGSNGGGEVARVGEDGDGPLSGAPRRDCRRPEPPPMRTWFQSPPRRGCCRRRCRCRSAAPWRGSRAQSCTDELFGRR